jgi:hypothetical protein
MIYRLLTTLALILSLNSHTLFAENGTTPPPSLSGRFFNLSYIGNELSFTTATPAWFYQFAGISSLTSGFNFLNCTPSDNGFCLFSVSDTLSGTATLRGPAVQPTFKLCLNGIGNTYSCESLSMGDRFAYVANFNNSTVSLCPINSNGTLGTCTASNPGTTFSGPFAITLNAAGTLAYVANDSNNTVSLCPINSNGTLGTCTASNPGTTFSGPAGIVLF